MTVFFSEPNGINVGRDVVEASEIKPLRLFDETWSGFLPLLHLKLGVAPLYAWWEAFFVERAARTGPCCSGAERRL
jgi:hypothetical protein